MKKLACSWQTRWKSTKKEGISTKDVSSYFNIQSESLSSLMYINVLYSVVSFFGIVMTMIILSNHYPRKECEHECGTVKTQNEIKKNK